MPDTDLRSAYEAEVRALAESAAGLRAQGWGDEPLARWATAQRNALKQRFRALTPADQRARLEAWTLRRYGNALGPTAEQLHASGRSWREIVEGACRPGRYRGHEVF